MKNIIALVLVFSLKSYATMPQAVPIPEGVSLSPQLEFAGTGIATLYQGQNAEHNSESGLNLSDSSLFFGASERLYDGAIGSFGFGNIATDVNNKGSGSQNPYFLHQSFVDYQAEKFEVVIGRTANQTAHIIDFPTIREEDLITLTNPLNPLAKGDNLEEHRFANVAAISFNQGLKYFENIHVQHLINSASTTTQTGINSVGVTFQYMSAPGLEVFETIPEWGIGYEHISTDTDPSGLSQIYGGAVINLNESIIHRWDLRFQEIVSLGSKLDTFLSATDSFQADSHATSMALRYLDQPFGMAGYQLALTIGYKDYLKVKNAKTAGLALMAVRQLGNGFDLVAQYQTQWRQSALAAVQTSGLSNENIVELGFSFNFDAVVNQHISPRRSLLNQQHQYIPN